MESGRVSHILERRFFSFLTCHWLQTFAKWGMLLCPAFKHVLDLHITAATLHTMWRPNDITPWYIYRQALMDSMDPFLGHCCLVCQFQNGTVKFSLFTRAQFWCKSPRWEPYLWSCLLFLVKPHKGGKEVCFSSLLLIQSVALQQICITVLSFYFNKCAQVN